MTKRTRRRGRVFPATATILPVPAGVGTPRKPAKTPPFPPAADQPRMRKGGSTTRPPAPQLMLTVATALSPPIPEEGPGVGAHTVAGSTTGASLIARSRAVTLAITSSGVEAPAVTPTVFTSAVNQAGSRSSGRWMW